MKEIKVIEPVLKWNDALAQEIEHSLQEKGIKLLNFLGSPGAGKTTLIEKTLQLLGEERRKIGVIEGDISTTYDSEILSSLGVDVVQINTRGACHLDAQMIKSALATLNLEGKKLIFVENVGNLVCPASFRIGERERVLVLSLTEGEHKPRKYPLAFKTSGVIIINKVDLLPHLPVNLREIKREIEEFSTEKKIFVLSSLKGEGFEEWLRFLKENFLT